MHFLLLLSGLCFGVLFLSATESKAQWQPDVRLTIDTNASNTSFNNARCVAAIGNDLHVVWYDNRDGNSEIYYKHSTDGGSGWGSDTRLTNDVASSHDPSVSASGSAVHVVWTDTRDGNNEIYYKRSIDGGMSWGVDARLTNNALYSSDPSSSVTDSVIHVVWGDNRDGNWEVYYKRSTDGGSSWGADTRLTNDAARSYYPSVSASGSVVHVVWQDDRNGNWEIYYKHSTDGGSSWGSDTRLTNTSISQLDPSVSASGSVVHVVWRGWRFSGGGWHWTCDKGSLDGGMSWGPVTNLADHPFGVSSPFVSVSESVVHVVWEDGINGNYEIHYKHSTDGGSSWGADTRLTINSRSSKPSVSISGPVVHVVWTDGRDGNNEVYYKRNPTGNPTGIRTLSSSTPNGFQLLQNYPNPFNPSTTVEFSIPTGCYVTLKLFNYLGEEVASLISEYLQPGIYQSEWKPLNVSSGIYYYQLRAGGFAQMKKLIYLR
jgi:hypothetical protein